MNRDRTKIKLPELITEYHNALLAMAFGYDCLSKEAVHHLQALGLLVEERPLNLIEQSYTLGMMQQMGVVSMDSLSSLTYKDFLKLADKNQDKVRLTQTEQDAVDHIKNNSLEYVKGLGVRVLNRTNKVIRDEDDKARQKDAASIKREMISGVVRRSSVQRIVARVRMETGNMTRDWQRLIQTELNNAFQEGRLRAIVRKYPKQTDPLVYKIPHSDACGSCKKAYLEADGKTPRLYRASELLVNGSNVGRKARDWKPVVGSHHPWCRCILNDLPPGFGFDKTGKMIYIGKTK